MITRGCIICDGKTKRVFQKNDYWIRACNICGHCQAENLCDPNHVSNVYSDHYFHGSPDGYPDYLAEKSILIRRGHWYANLLSQYMNSGSILDVGSAAGFILKGFCDNGWDGVGVEPNYSMAKFATIDLGLEVFNTVFEQFDTDYRYDLVSMIQVISHFKNPRQALQTAEKLLKIRGFVLVEMWDRKSLFARLMGERWHEYNPPSVLHWFSLGGLIDLGKRVGLKEVAYGTPKKNISGDHLKHSLVAALDGSRYGLVKRFLSLLVPDKLVVP